MQVATRLRWVSRIGELACWAVIGVLGAAAHIACYLWWIDGPPPSWLLFAFLDVGLLVCTVLNLLTYQRARRRMEHEMLIAEQIDAQLRDLMAYDMDDDPPPNERLM